MKSFRFPLQSLRVLREQKEQAAQKNYALALRAAEDAAARVKAAGDELSASWATLGKELAGGVTAMQLLRTRAWCNALELRLKERATVLEKARLAVDAVWQEMLAATRDREALDRYYKKNRRAHDRKAQGEEQKQMDELAVRMADTRSTLELAGHTKGH
ncbi:MAG: flagellar FliJ family protein [Verrucomicrobiota bacterium]